MRLFGAHFKSHWYVNFIKINLSKWVFFFSISMNLIHDKRNKWKRSTHGFVVRSKFVVELFSRINCHEFAYIMSSLQCEARLAMHYVFYFDWNDLPKKKGKYLLVISMIAYSWNWHNDMASEREKKKPHDSINGIHALILVVNVVTGIP